MDSDYYFEAPLGVQAPTLGFWAVDPVWSPPQAPGKKNIGGKKKEGKIKEISKIKETNPRILKNIENIT